MRIRLLLGAGVGATILAAGAAGDADLTRGPAPFADALVMAQSMCGKSGDEARARRAFFLRIGAAAAAAADVVPGPGALSRASPTPGIAYKVTTASAAAQRYFDIGLAHLWNFNHGEAVTAFQAAQKEDPSCAMCFWAEAFAHGPNINAPMADDAVAPAYDALKKAAALKDKASEKERALIDALGKRYAKAPVKDRAPLDAAFADAMEKVAAQYADDDFILALSAEANMDTQPWDYWEADGRTPKGRAGKTLSLIEATLARNPTHNAAIHLYIHTVEATDNPFRAAKYAEKLDALSPGLGHLIHMPSHIWARIGRYQQSIDENLAAVASDEAYLAAGDASPMYQFGYFVHNIHFVMTSAQMAGDGETALAMAKMLDEKLPIEMAAAAPFSQPIKVAPYYAIAQFADADAALAVEDPGDDFPFVKAAWHYLRGEAFAKKGEPASARAEAEAIAKIAAESDLSALTGALIPALEILKISQMTVIARAAATEGDFGSAVEAMEEAVALQDGLNYTEPPYWYYPARQTLAAMRLRAGDAEQAEQLFVEALAQSPNNGWVMSGLAEAYAAQGDKKGAKFARDAARSAWRGEKAPAIEKL